ncbi:hypothetical protein D9613_001297 [Agrocybe pediades]|uniref:Uncharacterized protein n=1 Tax=Agrocybe pediades TaxID=84607 RepID=A0A8H4VWT6_9AGAR|nr:hypothetical protein D9613_001297 [Agrocybe pediades]
MPIPDYIMRCPPASFYRYPPFPHFIVDITRTLAMGGNCPSPSPSTRHDNDVEFQSRESRATVPAVAEPPLVSSLYPFEELRNDVQELRTLLLRTQGIKMSNILGHEDDAHGSEAQAELRSTSRSRSPRPIIMGSSGYREDESTVNSPFIIQQVSRERSHRKVKDPVVIVPASQRTVSPQPIHDHAVTQATDATTRELESVISDFSSTIITATFLASVSVAILSLAHDLSDSPSMHKTSLNKSLYLVLQVFTSLSLSFNLSVAIVSGSAASSQSLRLRLHQRATEFNRAQALETKLGLCSTMQYYRLLALTVGTACLFGLILDSPYAILIIVPVVGVVFYDSLNRGRFNGLPRRDSY